MPCTAALSGATCDPGVALSGKMPICGADEAVGPFSTLSDGQTVAAVAPGGLSLTR